MATTDPYNADFIPELWSTALTEQYKKQVYDIWRPKRSKGAQLLRDAALGHPEYPEPHPLRNMTATEVRMRHEQYLSHAADAMAYTLDASIFSECTSSK